jgi:hypothetical protein
MKLSALLCSASVLLAGCAAQGGSSNTDTRSSGNDCVFVASLNNWTVLDRSHLILWPSPNAPYLVDTAFPIEDLPWAPSIAFVDADHNGQICGYGMDEIAIPHSNINAHATIASIRRIDSAEFAKLSEQYHVKLTRSPAEAGKAPEKTASP